MSSHKKRFSLRLAVGLSLGLAGAAVYAGQVTNTTFIGGETLTHTHMNNIKTAVNDNDTRITNLQGNAGASVACVGNAGDAADGMSRVGSLCVDKYQARVDFTGCALNGIAGCTAAAVSTAAGSAATGMSWSQAARACANAGKRLLTSGEWMMAKTMSVTTLGSDNAEFVDGMYAYDPNITLDTVTYPGVGTVGAARAIGSPYIRNSSGVGNYVLSGINSPYNTASDATFGFRCAR